MRCSLSRLTVGLFATLAWAAPAVAQFGGPVFATPLPPGPGTVPFIPNGRLVAPVLLPVGRADRRPGGHLPLRAVRGRPAGRGGLRPGRAVRGGDDAPRPVLGVGRLPVRCDAGGVDTAAGGRGRARQPVPDRRGAGHPQPDPLRRPARPELDPAGYAVPRRVLVRRRADRRRGRGADLPRRPERAVHRLVRSRRGGAGPAGRRPGRDFRRLPGHRASPGRDHRVGGHAGDRRGRELPPGAALRRLLPGGPAPRLPLPAPRRHGGRVDSHHAADTGPAPRSRSRCCRTTRSAPATTSTARRSGL